MRYQATYTNFNLNQGLAEDHDQNADHPDNYRDWVSEIASADWSWFRRGYTGHEMLPEFGLINMFVTLPVWERKQVSGTIPMITYFYSNTTKTVYSGNGRAYDPVLDRML